MYIVHGKYHAGAVPGRDSQQVFYRVLRQEFIQFRFHRESWPAFSLSGKGYEAYNSVFINNINKATHTISDAWNFSGLISDSMPLQSIHCKKSSLPMRSNGKQALLKSEQTRM